MLPKSRERVFHYILERRAAETPDKAFLAMRGRVLTYAQANEAINRLAAGFAAEGVSKGERVLVMMPSGIDYILTWQALCKLGALMVPVNEAYQGRMLANQVADADARLAVVAPRFLDRWRDLDADAPVPASIVVYGDPVREAPVGGARLTGFADLPRGDGADPDRVVEYFDPAAILYTSGTTGPSKGVLYGHGHAYATAAPLAAHLGPDDVFYMFLPMFHTGLPHVFGTVLISGGTLAIREKFSTSQFWEDVGHFGATATLLIATMPAYLMSAPADARDRDNSLRTIFMTPLLKDIDAFKQRFGCRRVITLFNMTEASTPLITGADLVDAQSCGRPRPGITARIVDENDEEVAPGVVGELVLRADDPWEFNLGYWRNPEKTAEAWRNQWLHTGDLLTKDEAGNYYFKDRLKDAIRRRGENISSFELETEIRAHPAIAECAAVAVPSPMGEDEVKIVVTLFPGERLEAQALVDFLVPRLPAYMVPRFIEFRDELPRTPTGKIRKMALREDGTGNCWDREASGAPSPGGKPAALARKEGAGKIMSAQTKSPYALKEIFLADGLAQDERLWVGSAEDIAFRPLFLSASHGYWMTIARIRRSGIVSRHSHPQPVHGYTIKGRWRYLEHDWVAEAGSYIFEPPGDTHTLVVDAEGGEMMTLFQVHGSMIYLDEAGNVAGYDDVFTRIEQCRRHFEAVGLGASYVERFIR